MHASLVLALWPRDQARIDGTQGLLSFRTGTTTELYRLADISTVILDEAGEFIHAMPYRAGSYDERTPLMHEIRAEGIDL
jgi:hypothetical protein